MIASTSLFRTMVFGAKVLGWATQLLPRGAVVTEVAGSRIKVPGAPGGRAMSAVRSATDVTLIRRI